jgi:hypothetical protein
MPKNWCAAEDNVAFVRQFKSDSTIIARKLAVPVENILGLAAE